MPYIQDLALTKCDNCEQIRATSELKPLDASLVERVEAGEVVPAGECPGCGAYAHLAGLSDLTVIGYRPGKLLGDLFAALPGGRANDCQSCAKGVDGHAVMSLGADRWRFVCLKPLGVGE